MDRAARAGSTSETGFFQKTWFLREFLSLPPGDRGAKSVIQTIYRPRKGKVSMAVMLWLRISVP
jgi:hypothetical protein